MRTPTPLEDLYAWHAAALAGRPPVITHEPHCGWFRCRLVKKGCWVPAQIFMVQLTDTETGELIMPEEQLCTVDGVQRDAEEQWLFLSENPTTEKDFEFQTRLRAWLRVNEPDEWDPYRPVDMTKTRIQE